MKATTRKFCFAVALWSSPLTPSQKKRYQLCGPPCWANQTRTWVIEIERDEPEDADFRRVDSVGIIARDRSRKADAVGHADCTMFDSDGREGCVDDYENCGDYYRCAGGPEVVCPEDTVTGEAWFWGTHEALAITVSSSFSSSSWEITVRSAAGEIAKKVGEFKPEPVGDFGRPLAPLTKSGQGPIYLCVRLDYGSKATFHLPAVVRGRRGCRFSTSPAWRRLARETINR